MKTEITYCVEYEKYPNIWLTERQQYLKNLAIEFLFEQRRKYPERKYRLVTEFRVMEDI